MSRHSSAASPDALRDPGDARLAATIREAAPHVLVGVAGTARDVQAVRSGRLLAERLGGRLSVVYAFAPGEAPDRRRAVSQARLLAAAGGTSLVEVPAYSVADGLIDFALSRGVTHIVLAAEPRGRWPLARRQTLAEQVAGRLKDIDLLVINSWRPRPYLAG